MLYRDYLKDKYQNTAVKLANAEGVPCVLEYTKGKNIRNYEVYGNSVQDGVPTPESPVEIQSVGDLTKNLLYSNATTRTINGVTMTYDNGVITLNGTCTASANFDLNNIVLSAGTYTLSANVNKVPVNNGYAFVQLYDSTNNQTITLINSNAMSSITTTISDGTFLYRIRINKGTTYNNVILKPQLEVGTTATEYEPYGYKIPIVNSGKNLLSYPYNFTTRTENGLTFTDNGDGSITINGTATIQTGFMFRNQIIDAIDKAKAYVLSGGEDGNVVLRIDFYNGTTWKNLVNTGNDGKAIIDFTKMNFDYTRVSVALVVKANTVCDNITIKPQLELGETATEYEPYRVPVTANIYLDEPLRKVGDYADYIDFKNQKVVRNILKQSLSAAMVYKRLDSVVRILCRNTSMSQKYDTHMLSTIFNYNYAYFANTECIFHYNATHYNYYWSIYWSRLGLTYDGTNVYRTDDIEQTSLTDSEIVSIANEWLSTLSDKDKEIYMILDMPTEEPIPLPALKTFKGTNIISVDTSVQPSNIKAKYVRL